MNTAMYQANTLYANAHHALVALKIDSGYQPNVILMCIVSNWCLDNSPSRWSPPPSPQYESVPPPGRSEMCSGFSSTSFLPLSSVVLRSGSPDEL